MVMGDDDGWLFVCIHYNFLLQEKMFKGCITKKKMGILQNNVFMVYLYKYETNN